MRVCCFLIFTLLLTSCGVKIGAIRHTIAANDGYAIVAYDVIKANKRAPLTNPRAVFIYIQGSAYESTIRSVDKMASAVIFGARAVMVEKRGCYIDTVNLEEAYRYSDKESRVSDYITVIDTLLKELSTKVPIVLVGASEGGDIAATVTARCPRVTQLILIGSGGGITQKEEFRYMVKQNPGTWGCRDVKQLDSIFHKIETSTDSMNMWLGLPYRRWQTYANDAAINYLKDVNIPILLIHGDADQAVPVISARTLDSAMRSLGKTNLTYIEYPDVDHKLDNVKDHMSRYPYLEVDMIRWFEKLGLVKDIEARIFINRVKKHHKDIF